MSSIVDAKLARYGMKWVNGPYQIVNKYGVIVQKLNFDLRDEVLEAQQNIGNDKVLFKSHS